MAALTGALGRADAGFVKERTGFSIGGVAPLAHASPTVTLIDRELFRFAEIWAAAGHPNGVFQLSPAELVALTGAPVADVVVDVSRRRHDAARAVALHQRVPHGRGQRAGARAACARWTRSRCGRCWTTTTSAPSGAIWSSAALRCRSVTSRAGNRPQEPSESPRGRA